MKIIIAILFLISSLPILAQCPDDARISYINTQEKYDYFMENYPNCDDYSIIKHNNKFIGDARATEYMWTLSFSLIGILAILKLIFWAKKM